MQKHRIAALLRAGLYVVCIPVLLVACSVGNDFGAKLPVSNTYPKLNTVPPRPPQTLSPAEQDAMLREMQDLQQNHGSNATKEIEGQ